MDTISSQLLYSYSPERRPERPSRRQQPVDGQHEARRAGHAHRDERTGATRHRHEIDDHDDHRQRSEQVRDNSSLAYRRSERTALHIKTQEGDTVRLKIKASESLSVAATQDDDDGKTVSELELQARSRTRISFRVRGDLNEQEMAAIQAVIAQAGTMAENFFSSDTEGVFAMASALEIDATQLANVRIRMKTSEQLTYPMAENLPARLAEPPTPVPESAGMSPQPAVEETSDNSATPVASAVVEDTGVSGESTTPATGQPLAAGDEAVASTDSAGRTSIMANVLHSIGTFLNNLIDDFSGDAKAADAPPSADNMILKLQVFRSMLLSISDLQNPAQGDPATTLAADTLDAVSAQQTPLDAVA